MEKYRIAVGAPTLKDASNEAIACSEHLKKKRRSSFMVQQRAFLCCEYRNWNH